MSTKDTLSREQVIDMVGEAAVKAVEKENCDFTGRLQCDGDTRVEFAASVSATNNDGDEVTLIAYYYQEQESIDAVEALDQLDWEIEGFDVV